jgi:hypothetical protein
LGRMHLLTSFLSFEKNENTVIFISPPRLSRPKISRASLPAQPSPHGARGHLHPALPRSRLSQSISHTIASTSSSLRQRPRHTRRPRRRRPLHRRPRLRHPAVEHAGRFEVQYFYCTFIVVVRCAGAAWTGDPSGPATDSIRW